MKRVTFAVALIAALGPAPAFAQGDIIAEEPWDRPNLLLVNPGDLLNGVVSMEYERALVDVLGIVGGFGVATFNGPLNFGQPGYTVIGPDIGFRLHFIRPAPRGLWVGPYLSGGYVIANQTGEVARAWSWGAGAGLGYNFVFGRHFTFQLGAAGGFTDFGDHIVWAPRLKLGLGVVF